MHEPHAEFNDTVAEQISRAGPIDTSHACYDAINPNGLPHLYTSATLHAYFVQTSV